MTTFERIISPDLTVALDDAPCIVLRTPEREITVTNVDALKAALDDARTFQHVVIEQAEGIRAAQQTARLRAEWEARRRSEGA